MKNINDLRVKYTSPAKCPIDIKVGVTYSVIQENDLYFVNGEEFSLDKLKSLFTPIDDTWESKTKVKKSYKKEQAEEVEDVQNEEINDFIDESN